MKPCGRFLGLIVLAGFAVVTGFTLLPALAQTVDPSITRRTMGRNVGHGQ